MEKTAVSLRSPDISDLAPSTRAKRKWESDGDDAFDSTISAAQSRARTRSHGIGKGIQLRTDAAYALPLSTGSAAAATETNPMRVPTLSTPRRVPVLELPATIQQAQPQAYPASQLHSTANPSGHSSVAQDCYARTISCYDNDAMSIACTEPPASRHYSTAPRTATYSPHFQATHWLPQGQPGDALDRSHIPQVPLSSLPQPVPQQLTQANVAVYQAHPFSPVSPQQPGQLSQDHAVGIAGINHAFHPQAFGQVFDNYQHQPHLPTHHLPRFPLHQATQQQHIQAPYSYNGQQFPPLFSGDTRQLAWPGTGVQGDRYYPSSHLYAPGSYYPVQPPARHIPTGSIMDDAGYPGPETAPSRDAPTQDDVSHQQPTRLAEGHGDSVGFDEGMSDASGVPNTMDYQCDLEDACEMQDASLGAGKEPQEPASSSSMKEEDGAATLVPKSKRGPLNSTQRKQTAETRKTKACTRCRMQKMRCEPDGNDPTGACIGCKSFSKTSKKTIHKMPCFRGKITDAVLFRSGGLELTKRWKGTEMKDVGDRIHPKDVRTIFFTLGICDEDIKVEVVAFKPQPGDVTARFWMDGELGARRKKDLAHYCLSDIHKAASTYEKYIKTNAVAVMYNERAGGKRGPRDMIEETYSFVIRRFQDLQRKSETHGKDERELTVLGNLFLLWFSMRHSTGSSWIRGEEKLGMRPESRDETYPLHQRVSVPRMVVAQFDSINHSRLLTRHGKFILSELESLMSKNQPQYFFLVYSCIFILLREASSISADRYRHARDNYGLGLRYSIPKFVESLHEGCNNLLQHWHYYNAKGWPKPEEPFDRYKTHLANLESDEYDLLMRTLKDPAVQRQLDVWRRYKAENGFVTQPASNKAEGRPYGGRQVSYDWDHPFYWVSQMFEEDWQPHGTYQAEAIDPFFS